MILVQPIRNKSKINEMQKELLKSNCRDYMLFTIGISTGLRLLDILTLKASDVRDKTYITIFEHKTGKTKQFKINDHLKAKIDKYIVNMSDDEYLFPINKRTNKPLTKNEAYQILNMAGENVGLDTIGTHTMRKTFGYHFYKRTNDVKSLQGLFNQSAPCVTLKYIGID